VTSSATLVEPAFFTFPDYHRTYGDEVADLAASANYGPDPEQRLILDATFGVDRRGRSAAFEVVIIGSRQNIKTGTLKMAGLGKIFILERRLLIWSTHEFSTTQEAFRDLRQLIESTPHLDRQVKKIWTGNGDEAIELLGGQRIKFKARTKMGGRGLTGDDVFLDEGFALQPAHMGALLPTLAAVEDPQVVVSSSAGLATSDVLRGMRDRGRKGDPRMVYVEWTAEGAECAAEKCTHELDTPGCALDDESNYRRSNPALERRISVEYIRSERRALPPAEFARERLGWWDDPGALVPVFGVGKWEACAVDLKMDPEPGHVEAFGVAVSIDRAWSSIGAAAHRKDRRCHLGAVDRQRGTHWLLHQDPDETWHGRMVELGADHDCEFILDGRGPGSDLIKPAQEAGLRVKVASTEDVIEATAGLFDAVQVKGVTHGGYDELDAAVAGAMFRSIGDRQVLGRKPSLSDISMLEAVNLAHWAADGEHDLLDSIG
jgi:hypothetical protein